MSHISLIDIKHQDVIEEKIKLIKGSILDICDSFVLKMNGTLIPVNEFKKFKHLVHLKQGENKLVFNCSHVEHIMTVVLLEKFSIRYSILPVLIDFSDSNFDHTIIESFSLMVSLLQCFFRETMKKETNKSVSFRLYSSEIQHHRMSLSVEEAKKLKKEVIWQNLRESLNKTFNTNDTVIFFSLLAHNEYIVKSELPDSFTEKSARNPFYVNLGNKNLSLINSSLSYSWPQKISELNTCFKNSTPVDLIHQFDENLHHGTYYENLSNSLGSMAHELAHCFGLDHLETGIMNRGGDDCFRVFSSEVSHCFECVEANNTSINMSPSGMIFESLNFLPQTIRVNAKSTLKTSCKSLSHFGEAFWSPPCSVILENSPWLTDAIDDEKIESNFSFLKGQLKSFYPLKSIQVRFNEEEVILGLTEKFHSFDKYIYKFELFPLKKFVKTLEIAKYLPLNWRSSVKIVITDIHGHMICKQIVKYDNFY